MTHFFLSISVFSFTFERTNARFKAHERGVPLKPQTAATRMLAQAKRFVVNTAEHVLAEASLTEEEISFFNSTMYKEVQKPCSCDYRLSKGSTHRNYSTLILTEIERYQHTPDKPAELPPQQSLKLQLSSESLVTSKFRLGGVSRKAKRHRHGFYWRSRPINASDTRVICQKETQSQFDLPPHGQGVKSLLFADLTTVPKSWTHKSTQPVWSMAALLVNAAAYQNFTFWGVVGDVLYDASSFEPALFMNQLSCKAKSMLLTMVPGNHDYGRHQGNATGTDVLHTDEGQFGWTFAKFWGMDTHGVNLDGSKNLLEFGDHDARPSLASYHFFSNHIGNVLVIGFSGFHPFQEQEHLFQHACEQAADDNVSWILLLSHWLTERAGGNLLVQDAYRLIRNMPGCREKAENIKFFGGHEHCSGNINPNHTIPEQYGDIDFSFLPDNTTGFSIGANGRAIDYFPFCHYQKFPGNQQFGPVMVDSSDNHLRLHYVNVLANGTNLYQCVNCILGNISYEECVEKRYFIPWFLSQSHDDIDITSNNETYSYANLTVSSNNTMENITDSNATSPHEFYVGMNTTNAINSSTESHQVNYGVTISQGNTSMWLSNKVLRRLVEDSVSRNITFSIE